MARQVINTDPPIGDPAPTAFNKINAMTAELYGESIQGNRTISGTLSVVGNASMSSGSVRTMPGTSTNAGYVSFHRLDGVRQGYFGWNAGNKIQYSVENGYTGHSFVGTVESTGAMTAPAFNPTSSADVKDFIEGYRGDACEELDRLAVVTYRYRPEFYDSQKTYVGIIAENFADVRPDATTEETHLEQVEVPVGEDDEGNVVTEIRSRVIPMGYDMAQLLALNTRSHQQKSRRIRELESAMQQVLQRLADLESAA